jgi:hypothetical protein
MKKSNNQVNFSFNESLISRLQASIPVNERSRVIAELLAKEFTETCDLSNEIAVWDNDFGQDGLNNDEEANYAESHRTKL